MNFKPKFGTFKSAGAFLLPPVVKPKNPKKKYVRKPVNKDEIDEAEKKAVADSLLDFQIHMLNRFSDK